MQDSAVVDAPGLTESALPTVRSVDVRFNGNITESIQELRNQIPLLVGLTTPKNRKCKLRYGLLANLTDLNPNLFVGDNLKPLLPDDLKTALGPFHMRCIAQYCLEKSYHELMEQENKQYLAVLAVKQLYEDGRFADSSEEDKLFLRHLCVTGLLQFDNEFIIFDQLERRLHLHCVSASQDIVDRINSLREDNPPCSPHETRYPVVVHACSEVDMPVCLTSVLFNPTTPIAMQVVAGTVPLPSKMVVVPKYRVYLPGCVLQQLGPFSSIEEGAPFMIMSHTDLTKYLKDRDAQRSQNLVHFLAGNTAAFGDSEESAREMIKQLIITDLLRVQPEKIFAIHSELWTRSKDARKTEESARVLCTLRQREISGEVDAMVNGSRDYAHICYMLHRRTEYVKESKREAEIRRAWLCTKRAASASDEEECSVDAVPSKRARQGCSSAEQEAVGEKRKHDAATMHLLKKRKAEEEKRQAEQTVLPETSMSSHTPLPLLVSLQGEMECTQEVEGSRKSARRENSTEPKPGSRGTKDTDTAVHEKPKTPHIMRLVKKRKADEEKRRVQAQLLRENLVKRSKSQQRRATSNQSREEVQLKRMKALVQVTLADAPSQGSASDPFGAPARAPVSVSLTASPADRVPYEDASDGFPSLCKPSMRISPHQDTDLRRSAHAHDDAAARMVPRVTPPPLDAIVQESQTVIDEIDSLKKQIEDNKRQFSLK